MIRMILNPLPFFLDGRWELIVLQHEVVCFSRHRADVSQYGGRIVRLRGADDELLAGAIGDGSCRD